MHTLRIAMIGQRGLPATSGGIERHVEEIGARLAAHGHEVTVYSRTNYVDERVREHRGMRVRHLPTINTKHLDAVAHSALATLDAAWRGHDIIHYHALGPGLLSPLPRYASPSRVVLTVHGLDNERAKWSPLARRVLDLAAWTSAKVPDATITVSHDLTRHYAARYQRATTAIHNGVTPGVHDGADLIRKRWGLAPNSYVLFVGRLVPEKEPHTLMRAFARLGSHHRLVVAGGSSFTGPYVAQLQELAAADDQRVLLPGYVHGRALAQLYANAAAFVLPSALEGLPLTLLEAISYGTPVIASDIPPHREVLVEDGAGHHLFPVGDVAALASTLQRVLGAPVVESGGAHALRRRVLRDFDWDRATARTCRTYSTVLRRPVAGMEEVWLTLPEAEVSAPSLTESRSS